MKLEKQKKIRIAFDDTWDILYSIRYRTTEKRPYIETIYMITYTPVEDVPKVRII